MAYCLNSDCPYRKRVGKPAEFVEGIELCSDCGSPLSEDLPSSERPEAKEFTFTDWHKRILFTLGVLFVYRALSHMPAPGINFDALESVFGEGGKEIISSFSALPISIFALGLMPYISASIFVELFALFIPSLKRCRQGGYLGREELRHVVLITTLCFALIQGYGIAVGVERMSGGLFVSSPGVWFRLLISATLTASMFLLLWLARLITSRGIGHGISIIIIASHVAGLIPDIVAIRRLDDIRELGLTMPVIFFIFLALFMLVIIVEKIHKKLIIKYEDGEETYIPIKLTTAGIIPTGWAASIISFPAVLAGFIGTQTFMDLSNILSPGGLAYSIIYATLILVLYFLFSYLFYRSRNMISDIHRRNARLSVNRNGAPIRYLKWNIWAMAFVGAIYLCIVSLLPDILRTGFNLPVYLGGTGFILTVAIALDIFEEVRMRRNGGNLVKVAEVHDVPTAGLAKSVLEGKGVSCHLRGYYHRALLYFFGPYIEISVLVPEGQVSEAQEVIGKYVGSELLVQREGAD